MLKSGGAAREFYISDLVTHVIAKDTSFPQFNEAKDCNLAIVKVQYMYIIFYTLVNVYLYSVHAVLYSTKHCDFLHVRGPQVCQLCCLVFCTLVKVINKLLLLICAVYGKCC